MNKKTIYIIAGSLVALIVFLVIAKKAGWIGNSYAIEVAVEKPERRRIVELITANGKIQPEMEVKISADVSGEIVELMVQEGDSVKKGDLLLRIKPDIYTSAVKQSAAAVNTTKANLLSSQARLTQAEAQFTQMTASFERSQKLWKDKTISDADFEQAKAQYASAQADLSAAKQAVNAAEFNIKSSEASLDQANENLNKTSIYAPISGIVSQLNVEKGERVVGTMQMTGTEIMRLADLNHMEVKVDVNENDIVHVSMNDTANIEVDAYLGIIFKGIVTEIANSANTAGVSSEQVTNFEVKIRILPQSFVQARKAFPNNKFPFRPGMTATTDIETMVKNSVLSIPIQAVTVRGDSSGVSTKSADIGSIASTSEDENQTDKAKTIVKEDKEVVFVYEKGKTKMNFVTTGIQDNLFIEITSGLSDSAEVVVAPYNAIARKLKNDQTVTKVSKQKLYIKEK
jgi:HlyD family secretion protein